MERSRCKSIYCKYCYQRTHTLQEETTSPTSNTTHPKQVHNKNLPRDVCGHQGLERKGSTRGTTSFEFQLPIKNVFDKEIRWKHAAHIRPKGPQPLCSHQAFPINFPDGCSGLPTDERLDGKNRSAAGIFSLTNRRDSSPVFESLLQPRGATTNSATIWPVFSPPDFCSSIKLDCRSATREGYKTPRVSGRLYPCKPGQAQASQPSLGDAKNPRKSRLAGKLPKISSYTHSTARIPRTDLEHTARNHGLAQVKGAKGGGDHRQDFDQSSVIPQRDSVHFRSAKLCQLDNTAGAAALPPDTEISKRANTLQTSRKKTSTPHCPDGAAMVEEGHKEQLSGNAPKGSDPFLNNGCSRYGLGCSPQRELPDRDMVKEPEAVALKSQRVICRLRRNKTTATGATKRAYFSSVGQQDPRGVHTKRGRHAFSSLTRAHDKASGADVTAERHALGGVSPGEVQRHSRPPIKESTSAGMAFVAPGLGGRVQKLGRSRSRLVRFQRVRGRGPLCNMGLQRWVGNFLRRIQSAMEVQIGLGVPAAQPDATGTSTSQYGCGNLHSSSTAVDAVLLAGGSTCSGTSRTIPNTRFAQQSHRSDNGQSPSPGREDSTSGMESWGWADQVAHWSIAEKDLLKKSWRDSTLSTYNVPIKRWLSWCNLNGIDARAPRGNDVARYLANLFLEKKLAYRTMLVHKSAIATYSATGPEEISNNFFVRQVIKAISLARPQEKRSKIWDTELLFDWLKDTPSSDRLFDVSRRTAIILLLASGRRVHDLTLLDITEDSFFENKDNELELWPRFGSKTDCGKSRQSGWLLRRHPDERLCPVRHVNKLIDSTRERRLENKDLTSLFISITGEVKPATRTIIGGWIKSIFREIGIDAPPGSVRSAVASRSFLENRPLEEILKRANWKSAQTFHNHYCRSIEINNGNSSYNYSSDQLSHNFSGI